MLMFGVEIEISVQGKRYAPTNTVLPVDPNAIRSLELLGFQERALAAELSLAPDTFIVAKVKKKEERRIRGVHVEMQEAMMREYMRAGRLSKADAKSVTPIDPLSAGVIYEFLVESKWIVVENE